jgi:glycosyltransferase involved in cell wall biosynthesis
MNILFVAYHTCARAAKEARALGKAGHQVIILQHVAASEEILYSTELSSFYHGEQALRERIAYFSDWAEVIHVHNEPNWIVIAAAAERDRSCPGVPVVFDVHDLESMRESGDTDKDETAAIHAADAFIFPSRAYMHGVRTSRNVDSVPCRVIYSMCGRDEIVDQPLPRVNGIVYEGAAVAPLLNFNNKSPGWKGYRDYSSMTRALTGAFVPFHLYGIRKEFQQPYINAGAIVHDMIRYPDLLKQLSRYDWGLCGHLESHPQWNKAMPNKLFEYLAAGIPVISINADEVSDFVSKHGLGVVAKDLNELNKIARDRKMRSSLAEKVEDERERFTMGGQVNEIEALYAQASAYRKIRLDAGMWMHDGEQRPGADRAWVCSARPEDFAKDNGGGDQLLS